MPSSDLPFSLILPYFAEAELPLTLGEETVRAISAATPPLPSQLIEAFLLPIEEAMVNDEFTEFVACFQLPPQKNYLSLIYWRADLLQYHYVLATLHPSSGELIDRRVIAGTSFDGVDLTQSSAAITPERTIYIVSGQGSPIDFDYKAAASTAQRYQISEQGKILEI